MGFSGRCMPPKGEPPASHHKAMGGGRGPWREIKAESQCLPVRSPSLVRSRYSHLMPVLLLCAPVAESSPSRPGEGTVARSGGTVQEGEEGGGGGQATPPPIPRGVRRYWLVSHRIAPSDPPDPLNADRSLAPVARSTPHTLIAQTHRQLLQTDPHKVCLSARARGIGLSLRQGPHGLVLSARVRTGGLYTLCVAHGTGTPLPVGSAADPVVIQGPVGAVAHVAGPADDGSTTDVRVYGLGLRHGQRCAPCSMWHPLRLRAMAWGLRSGASALRESETNGGCSAYHWRVQTPSPNTDTHRHTNTRAPEPRTCPGGCACALEGSTPMPLLPRPRGLCPGEALQERAHVLLWGGGLQRLQTISGRLRGG